ncbi:cyclin-dependent kinase 10-like [Helianthus annuus]|uniref:cyclin-dependent kinase 10-like n=1 Tax=Helianthus annuus TaxID=4232 RepID=UPI001652E963|nr:cyclin-dependent kinase 10-like [Helianthus annuus]
MDKYQKIDEVGRGSYGVVYKALNLHDGETVAIRNCTQESIHSHPPLTQNVTTPAYRAPEVFLETLVYDTAVDIWAVGVILAELFTRKPLFQGCSGADVMYKMCKVLGTPTETTWPGGLDLARKMKYQFPVGLFGYQFSALLLITPILFRMAMECELLKKEACLRSCIVDEEKDSKEELVRMLPEYLFDYEMEKESKCRFTELAPTFLMGWFSERMGCNLLQKVP